MNVSERVYRAVPVSAVLLFLAIAFQMLNLPRTPFFGFAVGGAFLTLLAFGGRRREVLFACAASPVLYWTYSGLGGQFDDSAIALLEVPLAFVGLASSFVLGWRAIRHSEALGQFLVAVSFPASTIVIGLLLCILTPIEPRVYDLFLYRFDNAFGFQASSAVAHWVEAVPALRLICILVYRSLPLAQMAVVVAHIKRKDSPARSLVMFATAGIVGCALYHLLPAVGPIHAFGLQASPIARDSAALTTIAFRNPAPRNCVPSLHFAWAILILCNISPRNRTAFAAGCVFLGLTALATLGLGEHYLVDLIVAVPFAACIHSACTRQWTRAMLLGTATLLWTLCLRFGMALIAPNPKLVWSATVLTFVISYVPLGVLSRWPRLQNTDGALGRNNSFELQPGR